MSREDDDRDAEREERIKQLIERARKEQARSKRTTSAAPTPRPAEKKAKRTKKKR